jgi:hypothetical protein
MRAVRSPGPPEKSAVDPSSASTVAVEPGRDAPSVRTNYSFLIPCGRSEASPPRRPPGRFMAARASGPPADRAGRGAGKTSMTMTAGKTAEERPCSRTPWDAT